MKTVGILILGWTFVTLGVLGLFLPFLQGILFIMIGLALLSSRSQSVKRLLTYLETRYPDQYRRMTEMKENLINRFRRK